MFEVICVDLSVHVQNKGTLIAKLSPIKANLMQSNGSMRQYEFTCPYTAWTEFKAWVLIKTGLDIEEYRPCWAY